MRWRYTRLRGLCCLYVQRLPGRASLAAALLLGHRQPGLLRSSRLAARAPRGGMRCPYEQDRPLMHDPLESPRPKGTRLVIRLGLQAVLAVLFLTAAGLGTVSGLLFAYA